MPNFVYRACFVTITVAPYQVRTTNMLAMELQRQGKLDEVGPLLQDALELASVVLWIYGGTCDRIDGCWMLDDVFVMDDGRWAAAAVTTRRTKDGGRESNSRTQDRQNRLGRAGRAGSAQ